MNILEIIENFYPEDTECRRIFLKHSIQVRDKALEIYSSPLCASLREQIDLKLLTEGAMLHDIGIKECNAPGICCTGKSDYITHGITGGKMLREYGAAHQMDMEAFARICERHTGAGITEAEIQTQKLPLPSGNYLPETLEEKLICLADKFYSKSGDMKEKSLDRIRKSLSKFGKDTLERFDSLCRQFGVGYYLPYDFEYLKNLIPDIRVDLRYFNGNNFMGRCAEGYSAETPSMKTIATFALKKAADEFRPLGYRLIVYDAYRPQRAVNDFLKWSRDPSAVGNKSFYPKIEKADIFPSGFLAVKSSHSMGYAIDLSLIHSDGSPVDMGGSFDMFDTSSYRNYTDLTEEQLKNRKFLSEIMEKHGFLPLESEWWHFYYGKMPSENILYDFEVR